MNIKLLSSCILSCFFSKICFGIGIDQLQTQIEANLKQAIAKKFSINETQIILTHLANASGIWNNELQIYEPQCAIYKIDGVPQIQNKVAKYCIKGFNCKPFYKRTKEKERIHVDHVNLIIPETCINIKGEELNINSLSVEEDAIILMPFAKGVKIYNLLTQPTVTEEGFINCFSKLGTALAQLNQLGFYHGDANFDNVLFDISDNEIKINFIDLDDETIQSVASNDLQDFFIDLNPLASTSKESLNEFLEKNSDILNRYKQWALHLLPFVEDINAWFSSFKEEVYNFDLKNYDETTHRPLFKALPENSTLIIVGLIAMVESYNAIQKIQ